jgi:peroxiredoxin
MFVLRNAHEEDRNKFVSMKEVSMSHILLYSFVLVFLSSFVTAEEKPVDFNLPNIKGSAYKLSEYRGKVVMVSFWATWCRPCQVELPIMQKIWKEYRKEGFEFLSVNIEPTGEKKRIARLAKQKKYEFPILLDSDSKFLESQHPSLQLPFSILLDKKGHIVFRQTGYIPDSEKKIVTEIKKLLKL